MKVNSFIITLFILVNPLLNKSFCQSRKIVQNDKFNLSVMLPPEWKLTFKDNSISIVGPIPENMVITHIKHTNANLNDNFDYYINKLLREEKMTLIKKGTERINGLDYKWMEYEMENMGYKFHDYLYLAIYKNQLYSIVLTSNIKRYKEYSPILLKILRSIEMK